nr:MAG TPA: hypothetical protein [Caudoviricetes sp.]
MPEAVTIPNACLVLSPHRNTAKAPVAGAVISETLVPALELFAGIRADTNIAVTQYPCIRAHVDQHDVGVSIRNKVDHKPAMQTMLSASCAVCSI